MNLLERLARWNERKRIDKLVIRSAEMMVDHYEKRVDNLVKRAKVVRASEHGESS